MKTSCASAVWRAIGLLAVLAGGWAGGAVASEISGPGDFGQISKRGFAETVQGSFYKDNEKTEFPNLLPDVGSPSNSYSWSMAWFQNALWVGTVREVHSSDRVAAGPAEVWRYQPSAANLNGDFGLSGNWSRIYVSPNVDFLTSFLSRGLIPRNFPRYFGFRGMEVCNAGNNVPRLYMTATGLPPAILYWNGSTFAATSSSGLPTSVVEIGNGTGDIGFRGLTCFKGRLFTSPAGTLDDVDAANNPVLLMNTNPAGGAAWQTVLDVKNQGHPLADPDNIGIFQVEAVGDYLWLTVSNRTTGFELWRGDGSNCQEPWVSSACNITWAKIIDNGAGRPPENFGPDISNAGATLGVFGSDLYVAPAESGFAAVTFSELLRVKDAHAPPNPGNRAEPHQWQLLAGWPRKDFDQPDKRLPGLENLDCEGFEFDMPNWGEQPALWSGGGFFGRAWLSPGEMDDDTDIDDCRPRTDSGPGLAVDGPYLDPLLPGPNSYLWRMVEHEGSFFVGSLNVVSNFYPGINEGFNLYKTDDGINFELLVDDGLGNPAAYGARSLVSTPIGLAVGSANGFPIFGDLDTAGTDVHIGTTLAGNQAAPKADAGPDQLVFDTGQVGSVNVTLTGAGEPTFGGSLDDGPYEWFAGSVASLGGSCSGISTLPLSVDPQNPNLEVSLASLVGGQDVNEHIFTLRVTNAAGRVSCDQVTITASYNLPPKVHSWFDSEFPLYTSVPTSFGHNPPRVAMIDFDGDGVESYDVVAHCSDPESALVRCQFEVVDIPGVSLSNRMDTVSNPLLCAGQQVCQISARLTVPSNVVRPEVRILAGDDKGYENALRFRSVTRPVIDTPDVNDSPVCRSVDVTMIAGVDTEIVIDPATFDPPICVDPDGDPLTYQSRNPPPSKGTATFGSLITYTPTDPHTPMVDQIEFRAWDPNGLSSSGNPGSNSVIRVILAGDAEDPEVAIGFPAQGASYNSTAFAAGCGTPQDDICGSASDDFSGVSLVEVAIRRDSDGYFWNGSEFVDTADVKNWLVADGTDTWSYDWMPVDETDYTVMARAVDGVGNVSEEAVRTLTLSNDMVPPSATVTFPVDGGAYYSRNFNGACGTSIADVCGSASATDTTVTQVEVSIERLSDGAWWNGSSFVGGSQIWIPATQGTTSWRRNFSPSPGAYEVQARATDGNGLQAVSDPAGFTYYSSFFTWLRR